MATYDAVIVGSGPNGLAAAILLAQQGLKVHVIEAEETIGGGTRTKELTESGFLHDVCSAVHPTAVASPFLSSLPLEKYGLEWIYPEASVAHPLEEGNGILGYQSLDKTLEQFGKDAKMYKRLFGDFIENWDSIKYDLFGTLRSVENPLSMARFGWYGWLSAKDITNSLFKNPETKALFAGMAAHSILPLDKLFSASFGLVLTTTMHAVGWPIAKGGSATITKAMASYLESLDGTIETGNRITDFTEIPDAKAVLFDLTPHQITKICSTQLPNAYRKKLNKYKYGPGAFKIDLAVSEPIPWKNEAIGKAGTVHLGGSFEEIGYSEKQVWQGNHPEKPYVLLSQPSIFDDLRAPKGKHTVWAYCHVPNGSDRDCTEEIVSQIERYAPGFRDTIIAKHTMTAVQMNDYNENYIGGDINGGAQFFKQLIGRPVLKWDPYKIPFDGAYICSSSTPPGGGVHGMCGYHAAKSALKNEFGIEV
ncbi:MAG: NAD(P)/FAD-dependent oxidoreductase [Balneolaceae bacterium]|nr:NAD(P)/FAD-dependent oxidoreductase [Balneolaceae bacterium]